MSGAVAPPHGAREAALREEMAFLADELYDTVYGPEQWDWDRADCPWCRRLAAQGITDEACPICSQVATQGSVRGPPAPVASVAPVYAPDHRGQSSAVVTITYMVDRWRIAQKRRRAPGARETQRARHRGTQLAPHERGRARWQCALVLPTPPATVAEAEAFAAGIGESVARELLERPLLSMGRP